MAENFKKHIQKLLKETPCKKKYNCLASDLEQLCNAKKMYGVKDFLECLEENPTKCNLSVPTGGKYFCNCPIRNLIKKHMNKQFRHSVRCK